VVDSYRDMGSVEQKLIFQIFIVEKEQLFLSDDFNYGFFSFPFCADKKMCGFFSIAFPVEDFGPQLLVIFQQEQTHNRQDDRYSQQDGLGPTEFQ
jgi:hypothetical protein